MDPRKAKQVSTSKARGRGRGRGSRSNLVRPPQAHGQEAYYPRPPPNAYYPQPPQQAYFTQPPPMNPSNYNIAMTSEFNPFDYRDGPPRREQSVERELPIYDDEEDEDEFVPETQFPNALDQDDDEVQEIKEPGKAGTKKWTPDEEVFLAKAWVHVSTCPVVGNEQKSKSFWTRIFEHFQVNVPDTERTFHGLNTKWKNMHADMNTFNGLYHQQNRVRESGLDNLDVMKNAMADFKKKTKGRNFNHIDAWEIVKKSEKWLQQPSVNQAASSSTDKRRKSPESINDYVETIIPDLNDDTTPTRKKKGKKAENETTKKSIESLADYAAKKAQQMDANVEKKRAKEELTEKLMSAQLQGVEEKNYFRALKFFNDPHDHLPEPMRDVMIAKKREVAAKYGWPCPF